MFKNPIMTLLTSARKRPVVFFLVWFLAIFFEVICSRYSSIICPRYSSFLDFTVISTFFSFFTLLITFSLVAWSVYDIRSATRYISKDYSFSVSVHNSTPYKRTEKTLDPASKNIYHFKEYCPGFVYTTSNFLWVVSLVVNGSSKIGVVTDSFNVLQTYCYSSCGQCVSDPDILFY